MQKKAIRLATKSNYHAHTVPLFKEIEILPLPNLIEHSKIVFMYEYVNGKLPKSFQDIWIKNGDRNPLSLRNADKFYIPFVRCATKDTLPLKSFPSLWNEFSTLDILRNCQTKKQFSTTLKKHFLDNLIFVCHRNPCPVC